MRSPRTVPLLLAAALALVSCWPSWAGATASWYLLVPPAAYDQRSHLYARVPDAPLPRWYRDGEYDSERACHENREAKGDEARRLSQTTIDEDNFHREQARAFQHGLCVPAAELGTARLK